jgi:hypothetical protein
LWSFFVAFAASAATVGSPVPGESFVDKGVVQAPNDVFLVGESVPIDVTVGQGESCAVTSPSGAIAWQSDPSQSGPTSIVAEEEGTWVLSCSDGTEVPFRVSAAHPALWLPDGGAATLVADYQGISLPSQCDNEWTADPRTITDPEWTRACAWEYLLNRALPSYAYAPGKPFTQISAPNYVRPGTPGEPSVWLAASEARSFGIVLERLALVWLVAREDPGLSGYAEREYGPGTRYWAGYLVNVTDQASVATWKELRAPYVTAPLDDLERTRLLIALAAAYDWSYPELTVEERRAWRDVLVREAVDLDQTLISGQPLPTKPNARRRVLTNSHATWTYGSFGVAASVLGEELAFAEADERWREVSDGFFSEVLTGWDGSNHNGPYYDQHLWEAELRWLEASRLVEPTSTDLYTQEWLAGVPRFHRHTTRPNGQRATYADGTPWDLDKPSALLARIANEDGSSPSLAQRLAWEGHNRWTYTDNRREVLDVLWWDDSIEPLGDTAANALPTHACFEQGVISLRTSWSPTATHLIGRAGPLYGGHDDPDVGSLTLYREGLLVGDDAQNMTFRRSAYHSTVLIDGYGQHGDGLTFGLEPPDGAGQNDSFRLAFLDAKGTARVGNKNVPVDVVSYGVDTTQLYRHDWPADDLHWPGSNAPLWYTNVETSTRKLEEVRRWVIWLGGDVLLVDRTQGSASPTFRTDWTLRAVPTDASSLPLTCPIADQGGLGRWVNDAGGTVGMKLYTYMSQRTCDHPDEFPCIQCAPGSVGCPSGTALLRGMNLGDWEPVPAGTCPDPARISSPALATIDASAGGASHRGRLQVVSLDGTALTQRWVTGPDGMRIAGETLNRNRTGDGVFLTSLQPWVGSAPGAPSAARLTGGWRVTANAGGGSALVLVPDEATVAETGKTPSSVTGDAGLVLTSGRGIAVAQLLDGTSLTNKGTPLLQSTVAASVSATWAAAGIFGTVDGVTAPTDVWVHLQGRSASRVEVAGPDGGWQSVPFTVTNGGVRFRADGRVAWRVASGSAAPAGPEAICT